MIFLKKVCLVLTIILLSVQVSAESINLSAENAVIIEAESGRVLYQKNATAKATMASTTKIMTGLLACEYGKFDEVVTVSKNAAYQEGTSMYLKVGEKIVFSELLWGLLLSSGNDSAVAIAEHICGDSKTFAEKMTARAAEIGAVQTSFKNPNGLDEEGHFSTALDMAKITREALKNEKFSEIVSTWQKTTERGTYTNHNKLLKMYNGVVGVKTGFTKKSGRCLVSACEAGGVKMIAVTLKAPDDWNDHMKMYDYVKNNYKIKLPVEGGSIYCEIAAENGEKVPLLCENNIGVFVNSEEEGSINITEDIPVKIALPVRKGQRIGKITVSLNGVKMGESALLADRDVLPPEKDSFCSVFIKSVKIFFGVFL